MNGLQEAFGFGQLKLAGVQCDKNFALQQDGRSPMQNVHGSCSKMFGFAGFRLVWALGIHKITLMEPRSGASNQLFGPIAAAPAFVTTHWSLVLRAGDRGCSESGLALEKLCQTYWFPLYSFVRRQGRAHHEAQDLTQEFFSRFLESRALDSVHPEKGRFRSFLIASLRHFLANDWKHSRRAKRGGGQPHFSLDEEAAEGRYREESAHLLTPEKIFERRWAEALLQNVLDRLHDEWENQDATRHFEDLKPFLLDRGEAAPFASVATRLGVTEASLKWAVHKLRKRYREIFREEIAHTVGSPEDVDDEIRHLFAVMAG